MAGRISGAATVAALMAWCCGSALAAPPSDPPGKSGEAPGHQKAEEARAAEPTVPPGHAREAEAEQAVAKQGEQQTEKQAEQQVEQQAEQHAPAPVAVQPAHAAPPPSPRFENATGKPKLNVPAAAEAAPESSVSAPGNSGRHKLTICHKGHAITVDVHAARAHVDGHGDTYAPAGAKGRAACPQPSGPAPQHDPPANPGNPSHPLDPAAPGSSRTDTGAHVDLTGDPPRHSSVTEAPAATSAGPKDPAGGVSAAAETERGGVASTASGTERGGVASTVSRGVLPFTGMSLATLALLGLGLVAAGSALLVLAARRPAPATRR